MILTFLTRRDCHLCHEALDLVRAVVADYDVALEILDVDAVAGLADRYGREVPVVLVDGVKLFKFRVSEARLRRRLGRGRRTPAPAERGGPHGGEGR